MTIEERFPPSVVEEAWNQAGLANDAHTELREIDAELRLLDAARDHPGVQVDEDYYDDVLDNRDNAATAFNVFTFMASAVYGRKASELIVDTRPPEETPQEEVGPSLTERAMQRLGAIGVDATVAEKLGSAFNFESRLRGLPEMRTFAQVRGYGHKLARHSWDALGRTHATVELSADQYDPANYQNILFVRDRATSKTGHLESDERTTLDIYHLYEEAVKWATSDVKDKSRPTEVVVSFVSDYLNHALPELDELLPVTRPPELPELLNTTEFSNKQWRELLLQSVQIDGKDVGLVTAASIRAWGKTIGRLPNQLSHVTNIMQGMVEELDVDPDQPAIVEGEKTVVWVDAEQQVASLLRHQSVGQTEPKTSKWGIEPQAFATMIDRAKDSEALRARLRGYKTFMQGIFETYTGLLREHGIVPESPTAQEETDA